MYLQITTRCNMTCDHCCFSCTRHGHDMNDETFKQALKLYEEMDYSRFGLAIGGGEPTLHKRFLPWLFDAMCAASMNDDDEMPVFVATNGTNEKIALKIAALARKGIIYGALSLTQWHRDQIVFPSDEVIEAFRTNPGYRNNDDDMREIRGEHSYEPYALGRASDWGKEGCACDDMLVDPSGVLWECGCKIKSMGSIWAPMIPEEYYERDECCSNYEREENEHD